MVVGGVLVAAVVVRPRPAPRCARRSRPGAEAPPRARARGRRCGAARCGGPRVPDALQVAASGERRSPSRSCRRPRTHRSGRRCSRRPKREAAAQGVRLVSLAADARDGRGAPVPDHREPDPAEGGRHPAGAGGLEGAGSPRFARPTTRGIPVLILDTRIDREPPNPWASGCSPSSGRTTSKAAPSAGRYLAGALGGTGSVAIIEGISGHETADQRRRGSSKAIEAHAGIRVVASQTADWERARAYTVAENLLQAHPDLGGIFAANDEMAFGALEAVAAARRPERVRVIGFDAIPEALAQHRARAGCSGSVASFRARWDAWACATP